MENVAQREIERLHVRLGQLTIENVEVSKEIGMPGQRAQLDSDCLGVPIYCSEPSRRVRDHRVIEAGVENRNKVRGGYRVRTCGSSSFKPSTMVDPVV